MRRRFWALGSSSSTINRMDLKVEKQSMEKQSMATISWIVSMSRKGNDCGLWY